MTAPGGSKSVAQVMSRVDAATFNRLDFRRVKPEALPEYGRGRIVNRYFDILPAPESRVKLSVVNGDEATEYINANYVKGANGNARHYIAAQGPLPATKHAFLRMIFEHRSSAVVMVTNLVEAGRTKCEQYWPHNVGEEVEHDGIHVKLLAREQDAGFVRNELQLTHNGETHRTMHFWYNTWPDRGVPTKDGKMFTANVLKLVFAVRKHRSKADRFRSPAVVHCSAGVGRTGCFVCIDQAFGAIERGQSVDLVKLIDENRRQRMAFVQTEVQYLFAHRAISEYARWYLVKGHKHAQQQQQQQQQEKQERKQRHAQEAAPNKRAAQSTAATATTATATTAMTFKAVTGLGTTTTTTAAVQKEVEEENDEAGETRATGASAEDQLFMTTGAFGNPDNNADVLTYKAGEVMALVDKSEHWWHMRRVGGGGDGEEGWVMPEMLKPHVAAAQGTGSALNQPTVATAATGTGGVQLRPKKRGSVSSPASRRHSGVGNPFAHDRKARAHTRTRTRSTASTSSSASSTRSDTHARQRQTSEGTSPSRRARNPFAPALKESCSSGVIGATAAATASAKKPAKAKAANPFSAFILPGDVQNKLQQQQQQQQQQQPPASFEEMMDMVAGMNESDFADDTTPSTTTTAATVTTAAAQGVRARAAAGQAPHQRAGAAGAVGDGGVRQHATAAALEKEHTFEEMMDFVVALETQGEASADATPTSSTAAVASMPTAATTAAKVDTTSPTSITSNRPSSKGAANGAGDDDGVMDTSAASAMSVWTPSKLKLAGTHTGETDMDARPDEADDRDGNMASAQPYVSALPPWTFVDANGVISQLCAVSPQHTLPRLNRALLRAPAEMQGPAIVSHDHTWRDPVTGGFALVRSQHTESQV